ncbi:hypothetical protein [Nocardia brasiliensis]|uniref:hypothetical protein n=1 Tax=Nocardia brasiliensis TaxID=37326 RepID=UPI0024569C66|nr:hypothetical protein [Nocardia brasiliensis]
MGDPAVPVGASSLAYRRLCWKPPPASSGSGTGSAALVEGIAKLLATGSAGGPYCPGGAGCPKP